MPNSRFFEFKKKLNYKEIEILKEDSIISLNEFNKIFEELSKRFNTNLNLKKD